jgi:hypothetical protein
MSNNFGDGSLKKKFPIRSTLNWPMVATMWEENPIKAFLSVQVGATIFFP